MRGEECVMCTYPCSSHRYDTQVEEVQSILYKSQNQQVSSSSAAAAEMGTHEKEKLGQDSCMTSFPSMHILPPSSPESLPMVLTHLSSERWKQMDGWECFLLYTLATSSLCFGILKKLEATSLMSFEKKMKNTGNDAPCANAASVPRIISA